jgi:hypothetical protein
VARAPAVPFFPARELRLADALGIAAAALAFGSLDVRQTISFPVILRCSPAQASVRSLRKLGCTASLEG